MEVEQQANASLYERCDSRKAYRNGYKLRTLKTLNGMLNLRKPQLREAAFETKVFERYSRVERSLKLAIIDSYLQGFATKSIKVIVREFGIENISPSAVSQMAKELDDLLIEFLDRKIDGEMQYLVADAAYFRVRDGAGYVSKL